MEFEFNIGDFVYLKTDNDQLVRIVTGICIRPSNYVEYEVACINEVAWHSAIEMTKNKDIVKTFS